MYQSLDLQSFVSIDISSTYNRLLSQMEKCTKIFESARNECGKVLSASLFNITWYIFAVSHQTVHDKSNKLKYCFMYNKHSEDLCYSTNIV